MSATGYNGARWQRTRAAFLKLHPVCDCDEKCGQPAEAVHHRDGLGLSGPKAYDFSNLRALTRRCHNRITARETGGGWNTRPKRRREAERHPGLLA